MDKNHRLANLRDFLRAIAGNDTTPAVVAAGADIRTATYQTLVTAPNHVRNLIAVNHAVSFPNAQFSTDTSTGAAIAQSFANTEVGIQPIFGVMFDVTFPEGVAPSPFQIVLDWDDQFRTALDQTIEMAPADLAGGGGAARVRVLALPGVSFQGQFHFIPAAIHPALSGAGDLATAKTVDTTINSLTSGAVIHQTVLQRGVREVEDLVAQFVNARDAAIERVFAG